MWLDGLKEHAVKEGSGTDPSERSKGALSKTEQRFGTGANIPLCLLASVRGSDERERESERKREREKERKSKAEMTHMSANLVFFSGPRHN
jgi:hypothetical protein